MELVGGKRYSWCTCGHSKKQVKPPLKSSFIARVWSAYPVYSLITSLSFSLSVMAPTKPKPKACLRSALSQKKTPQSGCVVASTQTTHLTVMAHTSRTSSCLPHYMNTPTLEEASKDVFELSVYAALLCPHFCTSVHSMTAVHVNWSTVTSVWVLCLVSISVGAWQRREWPWKALNLNFAFCLLPLRDTVAFVYW